VEGEVNAHGAGNGGHHDWYGNTFLGTSVILTAREATESRTDTRALNPLEHWAKVRFAQERM
jgi:hypothetical protein